MSLSPEQASPACSYLTKPNIIHPRSEGSDATGLAEVTAQEDRARTELGERLGGVTVTDGAIGVEL